MIAPAPTPGLAGATAPGDNAPLLERAFSRVPQEGAYDLTAVQGKVPAELTGTYYLNGPARFSRGDLAYRHWLDGDGMVCALHFAEGRVRFRSRYVGTAKAGEEEAAGQALYRTFGTAFAGDRLLRGVGLASPANVSVVPFAGTLLALGEQGLPWELDPETLETRGEYTFGGGLNPLSPFAAHPKLDPATGEMVNFGISFAAARPALNLYRFNRGGHLLSRRRVALPWPATLHDFALGPRHAAFHLAPYLLDMEGLIGRGAPLMECLSWQPERGSQLLVVDLATGEELSLPAGHGYCLHLVNAWEDAAGRLVVDVLELDEPVYDEYQPVPDLFADVTASRPVRLVVDLARREIVERREIAFGGLSSDFPSIDPRLFGQEAPHLWVLAISATGRPGRKFFDRLVRGGWESGRAEDAWQAPPHCYLGGEPAFAPAREGPGGWIIIQQLDALREEGSFLLFDAFDLARGPVARLPLKEPIHLGFHAAFYPAWDGDRTEQLWR